MFVRPLKLLVNILSSDEQNLFGMLYVNYVRLVRVYTYHSYSLAALLNICVLNFDILRL